MNAMDPRVNPTMARVRALHNECVTTVGDDVKRQLRRGVDLSDLAAVVIEADHPQAVELVQSLRDAIAGIPTRRNPSGTMVFVCTRDRIAAGLRDWYPQHSGKVLDRSNPHPVPHVYFLNDGASASLVLEPDPTVGQA